MSLVGKYVLIAGEEFFQKGIIKDNLNPNELYMIGMITSPEEPKLPDFIVHVGNMVTEISDKGTVTCSWFFFDTEEEMDEWIKVLESQNPEKESNVLTLVKKDSN